MARRCIFCNSGAKMTDEHAIPDWVGDCLPGEGKFTFSREAGGTWSSDELTMKVARVCKTCNEGWMSRLEVRVKPLLCEALGGGRAEWTPRDQRRIATWLYKTAIVMDLATGGSRVPPEHYRFLRKNVHPPQRSRVWLAVYAPHDLALGKTNSGGIQPMYLTFDGLVTGYRVNGYGLTATIGHLAFQVVGYEGRENLHFDQPPILGVAPNDYNAELWPVRPTSLAWPLRMGFDKPNLGLYAERWNGTRAVRRTP
jgi:hypothetical protein